MEFLKSNGCVFNGVGSLVDRPPCESARQSPVFNIQWHPCRRSRSALSRRHSCPPTFTRTIIAVTL